PAPRARTTASGRSSSWSARWRPTRRSSTGRWATTRAATGSASTRSRTASASASPGPCPTASPKSPVCWRRASWPTRIVRSTATRPRRRRGPDRRPPMVAAGPATEGAETRPESIPLSAPEIGGNEWQYVRECLDTGWVSSVGAFVDHFEAALAAHTGRRYAVATVNGTSALHAALVATGIGDHDEVIVSTLTFIAPANAIRYTGAAPVFVDADPHYWQMDPDKLRHLLERQCAWRAGALYNRSTGRRVRAIMPVDVLGHPVDLDAIVEIARRYELIVIEDASESLGAEYRGAPVGRHGDIVCFSFNGNKIVTAGGGGMLLTDHAEWARRARHLTTQARADPVEYVHDRVGYNYRLTNLQAAVGVAQLERLGHAVAAKRRIAV